jgi:hypothetical protein
MIIVVKRYVSMKKHVNTVLQLKKEGAIYTKMFENQLITL